MVRQVRVSTEADTRGAQSIRARQGFMVEPRMTSILLVILTAALGASLVAGELRTRQARGERDSVRDVYEEVLERLIDTEHELQRVAGENKWIKALFERPLVATLSDKQAHDLTQAVLAYLDSAGNTPDQLN